MSASPRLRPAVDASAGDWIVRGVGPFGSGVGALVPRGFEAYGRILHPALALHDRPVRWATVSEWSGGTVHPRVQFEAMSKPRVAGRGGPAPFVAAPPTGLLPRPVLAALCEVLAEHTTSADRCRFCLWEGYGWLNGSATQLDSLERTRAKWRDRWSFFDRAKRPNPHPAGQGSGEGPRVRIPGRDYLLFEGPLDAASEIGERPSVEHFLDQTPNLFWPDDRAWCVATEIDLDSTYVGGSAALITGLLSDTRLEALRVELTDEVWAISDDVNL